MGCDIHIQVERKTDDSWEVVEVPERYHRGYEWAMEEWPDDRSYYVFSRLAGVRYHGDQRPDQVKGPDPRGFPADVSPEIDKHNLGDHSRSWATWPEFREALAAEGFTPAPPSEAAKSWGHGFAQLMWELDRLDGELRVLYAFDS